MLVCILLSALLPLTTTEVSTVPTTSHRGTTQQLNPGSPEATPTSTQTAKLTGATSFATSPTPQNPITAHLVASSPTNDIKTSTVYNTMATSSKDMATSTARNTEISMSTTSNPISNASSGVTDIAKTNTMTTEPVKVVVPTVKGTTQVIPTLKLSATTQFVPSVQNTTTNLAETTTKFVPTTSQLTSSVPKTTMKLPQTTRKAPPTEVTNGHEKGGEDAKKSAKHGKIVAGVIGGALIAMMIGFLVILYKKHKFKKHQIATTDWAGPTPFLEAGGDNRDNGNVTLRSSNRISLNSFLPQRFSKRMSLLPEAAEEMQDMQEMTAGTTFGAKGEKNGTKLDLKEAKEDSSESSDKTEEMVLVDETKEDKEEMAKTNGEATMKDGENLSTQPAPTEDAPNETKDENK